MYDQILRAANQFGCKAIQYADMKHYTTFHIGGPADLVVEPNSVDALSALLKAAKQDGVKPIILGRGSNVLVPDEGLRKVVFVMGDDFSNIEYAGSNMIRAEAGASVLKLCRFALEYSFGGLEFAYGIPGSVGGAIYMNAGAYGGEMKDVVMVVNHMDYNGEKGSRSGSALDFQYRHSSYMESDLIITSVIFHLEKDNPDGDDSCPPCRRVLRRRAHPGVRPQGQTARRRPDQ